MRAKGFFVKPLKLQDHVTATPKTKTPQSVAMLTDLLCGTFLSPAVLEASEIQSDLIHMASIEHQTT